jgi:hypothetical protein
MPLALFLLALALAASVLLGPLGLGLLEWRVSPNGLNQTYGADAASLLLVVPAALAASWLWRRGHRLAAPLALGVGLVTLYYAVAETLGGDYLRYDGNNERFFLLFLALIVLGWTTAARAWAALDPEPPRPAAWLGRGFGAVLLLAGGVVGLAWTAQLVPIALTGALGPEYLDSPSAFWTGLGLWRGSGSALKAAYGLASFLTLQGASVLVMGAVMLGRADPTATPALVYALTPIVMALAALTARLLVSYARGAAPAPAVRGAAPWGRRAPGLREEAARHA